MRSPRKGGVAHGVYSAVKGVEEPPLDPAGDPIVGQPEPEQLPRGDHARLGAGDLGNSRVNRVWAVFVSVGGSSTAHTPIVPGVALPVGYVGYKPSSSP